MPEQEMALPQISGGEAARRLHDLMLRGRWEAASSLAEEASVASSSDPMLQYLHGVLRFHEGDRLGALLSFRRAEKLGLDHGYLHLALGLAYYDVNQFVLFRQQMDRVIELEPENPDPHFRIGRYFEAVKNDFDEAIIHFTRAIGRDEDHYESHYFRGYCLSILQMDEDARKAFQMAIEAANRSGADYAPPYAGMAKLALKSSPDAAVQWARSAVEIDASSPEHRYILALAYEQAGDADKAMEQLEQAVRLAPDHPETRFRLSRLYRQEGRTKEAREELAVFRDLIGAYGDQ